MRHRWVKLKLHHYVCRQCGMGKVNNEQSPGHWVAKWHTPDGDVIEMRLTPPCAPGPKTAERLAHVNAVLKRREAEGAPA